MKKTANKCGVRFVFYDYATQAPVLPVHFINDYSEELSSDRSFATGDWNGANLVGFDDPITGTIKISTQIIPIELLALAAGGNGVEEGADLAHREVITCTTEGKISLATAPVAGSIYVYEEDKDCSGEPVASSATSKDVTIEGATVGKKYVAYYLENSTTAKRVQFRSDATSKFLTMRGITKWKDTTGAEIIEHVVGYKVQPKKAISLTYHGKGDPISMDMELDILEDDEGRTYDHIRVE